MINVQTVLNITDNSGGKLARCIKIYGGSIVRHAYAGDLILVSVIKANHGGKVAKSKMYKALIVRTVKPIRRQDGTYVGYNDNAVVLLNENLDPIGTRIHGVISSRVIEKGFIKVYTLANEVI